MRQKTWEEAILNLVSILKRDTHCILPIFVVALEVERSKEKVPSHKRHIKMARNLSAGNQVLHSDLLRTLSLPHRNVLPSYRELADSPDLAMLSASLAKATDAKIKLRHQCN